MLWPLLSACVAPAPEWVYGSDLSDLVVAPVAWDEGVHPDTSVLLDPNNPFATGIDDEIKWEILATDCAPGFYAFATALAERPTGEHQLYTSTCLHELYDTGRLAPEDTYWAWSAAIRGYQAVLDHFPDDVTYDASGEVAWRVAPAAYAGIVALGGTPEGWVEVVTGDGSTTVIPVGAQP